ncbi:MAG: hypothetical protein Q8Q42_04270 [Nanoarchaeota archaeon]|nr:hypothetical protein [Nanoarchaeota archaeon]
MTANLKSTAKNIKEKRKEAEKVSDEDKRFNEAYEALLEYRDGYVVDDNESPFCCED